MPDASESGRARGESSSRVGRRVEAARRIQSARFSDLPSVHANGQMERSQLRRLGALDDRADALLARLTEVGTFSLRGRDRAFRVARTIADLEGAERVSERHLAEAVQYRRGTTPA